MKKIIAKILSAAVFSLLAISLTSPSVLATRTPDNHDATLTTQIPTTDDLRFSSACSLPSVPDLTTTYASYVLDTSKYDPYYISFSVASATKASYQAAIADTTNGTWAVSFGHDNNGEFVHIAWTRDPDAHLQWLSSPFTPYDQQEVDLSSDGTGSGDVKIQCGYWSGFFGVNTAATGNLGSNLTLQGHNFNTTSLLYFHSSRPNFAYNYPAGYTGQSMPDMSIGSTDGDGDGLTATQEAVQGTSDNNNDTDGDGLSDFIESRWNTNRDSTFCGTECAYPSPTKKDLYVEVDWMKDSSNRSLKPSSAQINYVKNAYSAQGIDAHFDTGQYGGGNELPYYTQNLHFVPSSTATDFYDYKKGISTSAANFSSSRYHIWHYMISGYEYSDIPGSSGVSYVSDDDSFVSTGLIEDNPNNDFSYSNVDYAVAGTILHELGHTICLGSDSNYTLHPACYYQYIDSNSAPSTYNSVMNYSYQMSNLLDYSAGTNGSADHNDWGAVSTGFADFANTNQGDQLAAGKGRLRVGITRSQAKQLRKEHRLFTHVDNSKRSPKRQLFDLKTH